MAITKLTSEQLYRKCDAAKFDFTTTADLEERLSKLCFQVQTLEQQQAQYGLLLGSQRIAPGFGAEHQTRCLTALALYESN